MTPVGTEPELADRILGGRLGRIAGNRLGKPVEQGDLWARDRIDRCLRQAAALPLTDYLPEPAVESDGFELRPEWRQCVRGRIHGSCRDDDVDYAMLGLSDAARRGALPPVRHPARLVDVRRRRPVGAGGDSARHRAAS